MAQWDRWEERTPPSDSVHRLQDERRGEELPEGDGHLEGALAVGGDVVVLAHAGGGGRGDRPLQALAGQRAEVAAEK